MAIKPVSVTKVNQYIKTMFDTDSILRNIIIEGEVSNYKFHKTGIYLSLKDETSNIDCYISNDYVNLFKHFLENGIKIVATGNISVLIKRGKYTFNIKNIEVEGRGPLELAFEKIKKKLEEEGLFDYKYKKNIPSFPNKIIKKVALVTSNTGAAVEDMISIIKQRNSFVDILIVPVLVQGDRAADDIAKAIKKINDELIDEVDIMIVGRGGGSREDLWAFNEEIVARAIFNSQIPIISAVGHEIDVSISDMVADRRAATPTEAATIAVPSNEEIINFLLRLKENTNDILKYKLSHIKSEVATLKEKIRLLDPRNTIKRGYGAILDMNRQHISSVEKLNKDDVLTIVMADGEIDVVVSNIRKDYGK